MNIVVCVKYVPDATADRRFADDLTVDRDDVDGLLSELDEYAVEQALQIAEECQREGADAEVTVLTVGPEDAKNALRKALSMGADKPPRRRHRVRAARGGVPGRRIGDRPVR
jgi:electron transfer flavoprotein beta subunit